MSGIERDEVMAELEGGITGLFDLGVRLAEMGVREPIVMRSDFLTLTLTFDGAEPLATAAALRERAEAAELALRARLNEQPLIHSAQAAARAAEARASLLERAIRWALGEEGEFPEQPEPLKLPGGTVLPRRYWWRTELRARAALPPTRGGGNEGRGTT
jgi:hypothetical protein